MTKKELVDLFKNHVITTPDGRLIGDKENRFNPYMFSYTGPSGIVYTSARKMDYLNGKLCDRDIMNDRANALITEYKNPIKQIEEFNVGWGYEFKLDREVIIPIIYTELWIDILKKHGVCHETIPTLEKKYEKILRNKKNHFQKIMTQRYFREDFFDPYRHLNIEHDGSAFHIPEVDAARDEYLQLMYPSLKIERIIDFKNTKPEKIKELKSIFDKYLDKKQETPLEIRFDSWVIEQQLLKQQENLDFIIECLGLGYTLSTIPSDLATKLNKYAALTKA
jgi:hypothetical protein